MSVHTSLRPWAKVFFTSEGNMECEMDRRTGAASAVFLALCRSVKIKNAEGEALDLPLRPMLMNFEK